MNLSFTKLYYKLVDAYHGQQGNCCCTQWVVRKNWMDPQSRWLLRIESSLEISPRVCIGWDLLQRHPAKYSRVNSTLGNATTSDNKYTFKRSEKYTHKPAGKFCQQLEMLTGVIIWQISRVNTSAPTTRMIRVTADVPEWWWEDDVYIELDCKTAFLSTKAVVDNTEHNP